jgi:heat shock protein HtpX
LSVSEFRAGLVHEFGHYHGGDTALAPWVYKTRSTIGRTLEQLGGSLLQKPFIWYGGLFLRLTNAVARKQEYAADALAAAVTGPGPIIAGLKKLCQAGPAFETYWGSELEPLLSHGFRPPLAEGFQAFIRSPEVFLAMQEAMIQEMEQSVPNPYDTHPSLKDRIAALEELPAPSMPTDDHPALALIGHVAELEKELMASLYGEERAQEFQVIAWKDTVARVYVPVWREKVREYAKALSGLRLGDLPDLAADGEEFLRHFDFPQDHTLEEQKVLASLIIGAAVAAALYGEGCQVTNELGEPFKVFLAEEWVAPFSLMTDLYMETLPGGHWKDLCSRAGLSELDLGGITEAEKAESP